MSGNENLDPWMVSEDVSFGGTFSHETWGDELAAVGMIDAAIEAYGLAKKHGGDPASIDSKIQQLQQGPTPRGSMVDIAKLHGFDEAYEYGRAAIGLGRYQLAIAVLTAAAELQPTTPNTYCTLGGAYRRAGELENAHTAFDKAEELGGRSPEIDTARAAAYRKQGLHKEAADLLLAVLRGAPDNPFALNALGGVYYDAENYDKAEACFLKARRSPRGERNATEGLMNLQRHYKRRGDEDGVRRIAGHLGRLVETDEPANVHEEDIPL